jgi:hypothetical protein
VRRNQTDDSALALDNADAQVIGSGGLRRHHSCHDGAALQQPAVDNSAASSFGSVALSRTVKPLLLWSSGPRDEAERSTHGIFGRSSLATRRSYARAGPTSHRPGLSRSPFRSC